MIVPQMEPNFSEEELAAITEYMSQIPAPWLTEYKKTEQLEKQIADFVGAKYCVMFSNGTVSLIAALHALGFGHGDVVIVPDYTMYATATSASILGCQVELIDVERNTLCLHYQSLIDKVKSLPNKKIALMLVSINGRYPTMLSGILEYCKGNNIPIIEDAAQSLGSFYLGKHVGIHGEMGNFSFSTPKIISTGQGGCLVTNRKDLDNKLRMIKNFGRSTPSADDFKVMGWNFKFTDLQAVIGLEQMKKLRRFILIKRANYRLYRDLLEDQRGLRFIETEKTTTPWMNDILIVNREKVVAGLERSGIGSRPFYPALHTLTPYRNAKGDFPSSDHVSERGLWLPSSTKLQQSQIEYTCAILKEVMKKC